MYYKTWVKYLPIYAVYLTPYELTFRDIKELFVDDRILERVKVDMKEICFPHLKTLNLKIYNITPEELENLERFIITQRHFHAEGRQKQLRCYSE